MSPIPSHAGASVTAVVEAGATSTRYVRAGAGAPVLLLRDPGAGRPTGGALLVHLARRLRVFEPVLAHAAGAGAAGRETVSFSVWLRGFLDGLGVARASLVADERVAARALSFAFAEPGRVDRLVLLYEDADDPRLPTVVGSVRVAPSDPAVLLLRVGTADVELPADAADRVTAFRAGDAPPAP